MTQIINNADISSIDLKRERTVTVVDINLQNQTITTYYKEQKYYIDAQSNRVNVGEPTVGSWPGDYAAWFASTEGQAIKAAIEVELVKDVPGSEV